MERWRSRPALAGSRLIVFARAGAKPPDTLAARRTARVCQVPYAGFAWAKSRLRLTTVEAKRNFHGCTDIFITAPTALVFYIDSRIAVRADKTASQTLIHW